MLRKQFTNWIWSLFIICCSVLTVKPSPRRPQPETSCQLDDRKWEGWVLENKLPEIRTLKNTAMTKPQLLLKHLKPCYTRVQHTSTVWPWTDLEHQPTHLTLAKQVRMFLPCSLLGCEPLQSCCQWRCLIGHLHNRLLPSDWSRTQAH